MAFWGEIKPHQEAFRLVFMKGTLAYHQYYRKLITEFISPLIVEQKVVHQWKSLVLGGENDPTAVNHLSGVKFRITTKARGNSTFTTSLKSIANIFCKINIFVNLFITRIYVRDINFFTRNFLPQYFRPWTCIWTLKILNISDLSSSKPMISMQYPRLENTIQQTIWL